MSRAIRNRHCVVPAPDVARNLDFKTAPMVQHFERLGKLIDDCTVPGERRADQVTPAHGNGIQVSLAKFLVPNSTLRFRDVDDNASIVWQLRDGGCDGSVIKEGVLARCIDD